MTMGTQLRAVVLAVFVLVVGALPARSQGDPATALRRQIEGWLGTFNARTGGPIAVRIDGGQAVATLPDVVLALPEATVRLGTIMLTRSDTPEGRQRYEAPLPRQIRIESQGENDTITIGDGSFALVLDPRTSTFYMEEGRLSNLVVTSDTDSGRMSIAAVELMGTINQRADGLADAPSRVRVQDLRLDIPRMRQAIAIGEFVMLADIRGFRLADYERLRDATDAAARTGDPQDVTRAIEQWLVFPFATMPIELSFANLSYTDGSGAAPLFTAARLTLAQTFESLANPQTGYRLRYVHEGFALRNDVTPYGDFIPSAMTLEFAIQGMPSEEVRDTLTNGIGTGAIALDSFWSDALDSLLTAAIDNGATVRVTPFELTSVLLGITASATVTGNERSPFSAVGVGDIVIRGLDEAARAVVGDAQGGGPDSPAAIIAIISAIGQAGTDASGRPTRTYHIEVDEQGRMMLNGNDLSALFGGAPAAPQPGPAPGVTPGK
jgi:hypothetical protein